MLSFPAALAVRLPLAAGGPPLAAASAALSSATRGWGSGAVAKDASTTTWPVPRPAAPLLPAAVVGRASIKAPTAFVPLTRGFAADAAAQAAGPGGGAKPVPESQTDTTARTLGAAGRDDSYATGYIAPHPGMAALQADRVEAAYEHPTYTQAYLESIRPTHLPPKTAADRVGLAAVRLMRRAFDLVTGYGPSMTEKKWLQRMIFLETVAGVPGMVAGMLRHLHSLRLMRRDQGWIHTLLEEAENERMHLLSFMELRRPGPLFRAAVLLAQGVFFNAYFLAYLIWPKACHSFVGYLEEEAVRTYTHALEDIDAGRVWRDTPAPPIAVAYWRLPAGATMRDMILVVRADEACHSHVNHTLKAVDPSAANPFALGKSHMP